MKILNGIVTNIDELKIIQMLIPIKNNKARPQIAMKVEYITIHNTGNPGASAKANSNYAVNQNEYKSWHFTIGPDEVYQILPVTEIGYHAGDGANGNGNRKSIGIEIAEVPGAEETAIKFVAQLLQALNMSIDKVVPHKNWSGKNCPRLILPHWDLFITNIEKELKSMTFEEAKKIVQEKTGFDKGTMDYLSKHPYPEALFIKLAKAMK